MLACGHPSGCSFEQAVSLRSAVSSASLRAIPANRPRTRRSWSLQGSAVIFGGAICHPPIARSATSGGMTSVSSVSGRAIPRQPPTDQTELVPPGAHRDFGWGDLSSTHSAKRHFWRDDLRVVRLAPCHPRQPPTDQTELVPPGAKRHFWRDDLRVVRLAPCHPRQPPRTRRSWSLQGQEMLAVFNYRNRRIFG